MTDSHENRVASSKTTRGSQDPNKSAGYAAIVQPTQMDVQPIATIEQVNVILELGQLLRSVLTPDELQMIRSSLSSRAKHAPTAENYIPSSILDAKPRVTDDLRKPHNQRRTE